MLVLLLSFTSIAVLLWLLRRYRVPIRHRWRRRQPRTMCRHLRGRDQTQPPTLIYARLRAMDPLAFEELLLEAFELRGHRVVRNRRYTGDGGVDGEVVIDGKRYLIQAKRYRDTIRPDHVRAFADLCMARRRRGLFIHTGRTGGTSRTILDGCASIEIISGKNLLALLTGAPFELPSCSPSISHGNAHPEHWKARSS